MARCRTRLESGAVFPSFSAPIKTLLCFFNDERREATELGGRVVREHRDAFLVHEVVQRLVVCSIFFASCDFDNVNLR